jgi:hypothetical protein
MTTKLGEGERTRLRLEYAIRATRSQIRWVDVGAAVFLMLAIGVVFLLLTVPGDHLLPGGLSERARFFLRVGLLVTELACALTMLVVPLCRRVSDLYAARLIEKAHPNLRNEVVASLELAGRSDVVPGVTEAVRRKAADGAAGSPTAVPRRKLRRGAWLLAAATGAFGLYCLVAGKPVWPSILRALGANDVPRPTRTEIRVLRPEPGAIVVSTYPVRFVAELRHAPDAPAVVGVSRDGGATWLAEDRFDLLADVTGEEGASRFVAEWPEASASGSVARYRIECGDAVAEGAITVLPPPLLEKVQVTVRWPDYTGRPPSVHDTGHVTGLGSSEPSLRARAKVRAIANLPVNSASLVFERGPTVIMRVDGSQMVAEFEVTQDDRYRIVYRGTHPLVKYASIPYEVRSRTDAAPDVRLTGAEERVSRGPGESLVLTGEASDDFGLRKVDLVALGADGQRRIVLATDAPPGVASRSVELSVPAGRLGVPGQRVLCFLEGRDCLPPEGQVGRSEGIEVVLTETDPATREASEDRDPEQGEAPGAGQEDAEAGQAADSGKTTPNSDGEGERILQMARRDAAALDATRRALLSGGDADATPSGAPASESDRPESASGQGDASSPGEPSTEGSGSPESESSGAQGQSPGEGTRQSGKGEQGESGTRPDESGNSPGETRSAGSESRLEGESGGESPESTGQASDSASSGQAPSESAAEGTVSSGGESDAGPSPSSATQSGDPASESDRPESASGQGDATSPGEPSTEGRGSPESESSGAQGQSRGEGTQQSAEGEQGDSGTRPDESGSSPGETRSAGSESGSEGESGGESPESTDQAFGSASSGQAPSESAAAAEGTESDSGEPGAGPPPADATPSGGSAPGNDGPGSASGQGDASSPGEPSTEGSGSPESESSGAQGQSKGEGTRQSGKGEQGDSGSTPGQPGSSAGETRSAGSESGSEGESGESPESTGQASDSASSGQGAHAESGAEGADPGSGESGAGSSPAGASPASGMHAGEGAGTGPDPRKQRGDVDVQISPSDAPPPRVQLDALEQLIDEARDRARRGEVPPELLKELGMTPPEFSAFVERYAERFDRLRVRRSTKAAPAEVMLGSMSPPGSGEVQRALRSGAPGIEGTERLRPDERQELIERRETRVAPKYRQHVEDYLRTVSEAPTTQPVGGE